MAEDLGYMERIVRMHYDMRWSWDIEQSRSKGWVIRKPV